MEAPFTASDIWAQRFTRRLQQLQPAMELVEAVEACLDVFTEAADLDPAEAAEIYASECAPGDCGAPG